MRLRYHFHLLNCLIFLGAIFASTPSVYADSIAAGTYQATGITLAGTSDTLTGTITFNSSGAVTTAGLTFHDPAADTFSVITSNGTCCRPVEDNAFLALPNGNGQLELLYLPTLNTAGDIVLCTTAVAACQLDSYLHLYSPNFGPAYFTAGTLDPIAQVSSPPTSATPEPASLFLLGTGILSLAFVVVRQLPPSVTRENRLPS